ncbi:MAG TPA: hypothetical protein GXX28_08220 [Firmicutes bacterium]|nr:hypothetical protein [Bacillota bacterium]
MRKKSLRFPLTLSVAAALMVALAAGPALAWSYGYTTGPSWWNPKVWSSTPAPSPAPAPVPNPPDPNPSPNPPPATGLTAQEQQLLDLLNQARTENGVQPLAVHDGLTRVARLKAQDMVDNNYFSHHSPTLGWPPEMVRNAGISYRYGVGENIVEARSVTRAHYQLLASPTHKANMLDPGFTDVGIGVVADKYGGVMAVQEFIGR